MTVKELIEALQELEDKEKEIRVYDSVLGDFHKIEDIDSFEEPETIAVIY